MNDMKLRNILIKQIALGLNHINFYLSQIDLLPEKATEKMKEDILEGSGDTSNPIQGDL